MPPIAGRIFDVQTEALRNLTPGARKMAGLKDQHTVARGECVYEGSLAGSGTGRGIDDDGTLRLEDGTHALQNFYAQFRKFQTAVVNDRMVDGAQNAIRNVGRARDLQKVATGVDHEKPHFLVCVSSIRWHRTIEFACEQQSGA